MTDKQEKQYVDKPGKYLCKVKNPGNGWVDTSKSGTPFVRIPLLVDDQSSDQHGREIVWRGYLSEKSAGRTLDVLQGIFGTDWTDDDLYLGRVNWAGTPVRVVVDEEEYNGKKMTRAKWLNPTRSNITPETVEKIKKAIKAKGADARAEAVVPASELEGDDIQF